MTCDQCSEPAALQLTEIVGGEKRRVGLCAACARAKGVFVDSSAAASGRRPAAAFAVTQRCPRCGRSLAAIRKQGRAGCAECYRAFRRELRALLEKVHGTSSHRGHNPSRPGPQP